MERKTVLSEAELKALLGGGSGGELVSPEEQSGGHDEGAKSSPSDARLLAAVAALAARVERLEQQVKELRLQALANGEAARAHDPEPEQVESGHGRGASEPQTERESQRLSRVERYGKGSRRLF